MSDDRGRSGRSAPRPAPPQYTVYRSRPRFLRRGQTEPEFGGPGSLRRPGGRRHGGAPPSGRRILRLLLLGALGWLGLSLAIFLVSAQIEESRASSAAERALDVGGVMPFSANTILVLGSDARPKGSGEGGANVVGQPSRADTIMLLRAGGGASARLSIPRDTVVDIPGHGPDKVNAAYAIGGPALTITTLKQYLGIDINHVVEVNFSNFPEFIDSLGGVNVRTGCVKAQLDGGDDNGGTTIDLEAGVNHLDGRHALALARVRKNACAPDEDDLSRARRQQAILAAIKSRLISPITFVRLPLVGWSAPKAVLTDMSGPTLLQLFMAIQIGGTPPARVLQPSGLATTSGGGTGLTVSPEERQAAVRRFLGG